VELVCSKSLAALICNLATGDLSKGDKFLHVEVIGHGTGGQFNESGVLGGLGAVPDYGLLYEDFGRAVGARMSGGERESGAYRLMFCSGTEASAGGGSVSGIVAGESGHVVFVPQNSFNAGVRSSTT
jgi:hypothetical protein